MTSADYYTLRTTCRLLWTIVGIVSVACGCNQSSITEAIPGGRKPGKNLAYIVTGNWPAIVSNGVDCGRLPMGDIHHITKLPISPYEAWDQTRVSSADWLLSTDDRKTLQIRTGERFERVIKSFTPNHGVRIRGAIIDTSRKRIITVGRDEPARTEVDEFGGEGSLRVWDFNGKSLQPPYVFSNEPTSISRDSYADHIVVGTRGGGVHVFRSDRDGVEVTMHGGLRSSLGVSVAMSASGSFFAAAGAGGAKIWKNGDLAPKIEISTGYLPEESSGAVTIIHEPDTYATGRAVVMNGNHVRVYQLGDDITLQREFDLEIPGAWNIGPSSHEGQIVVIGLDGDGPRGSSAPFHIYALNVDSKSLSRLSWNSAENPAH